MKPRDIAPAALPTFPPGQIQAEIEFARGPNGATYVSRQRVGYPFHLGRALSLAGDPPGMPTVYLQSCSGGLFSGDDLKLRMSAGPAACAHVTSGASTIVHSMDRDEATQCVEIVADVRSFVEYMPDPMILFPHARLKSRVNMRVGKGATMIVGDGVLLHDPGGSGAVFDWMQSETRIEDAAGRLLACDRFRIHGNELARNLPGITGTSAAQASLFIVSDCKPAQEIVAVMREALGKSEAYAGAGLLPNQAGAWARMLAKDAAVLRAALFAAWAAARKLLTGAEPAPRRK